MASGNPNIGEIAKSRKLTFKDNPQHINRGGRPPKLVSGILKELKSLGYDALKPTQIRDVYLTIANLNISEIQRLANDKETPIIVATIAKAITDKNKGFDIIEKMLDRSIGKATEKVETKLSGEIGIKSSLMELYKEIEEK